LSTIRLRSFRGRGILSLYFTGGCLPFSASCNAASEDWRCSHRSFYFCSNKVIAVILHNSGNYQYGVAESLYMKDGFALNYPIKYIWPVLTHHKFLPRVKWSYSREFLKYSSKIASAQLSFHEQSSATKKSSTVEGIIFV
jgi:hypothetical protein